MQIEIQTPAGATKEWLIAHMKEQLVGLRHYGPDMSTVAVCFSQNAEHERVVEVDLPAFGSSLFIHRTCDTYEEAMREVLAELRSRIKERYEARNEPSDYVISSVEVEPAPEPGAEFPV